MATIYRPKDRRSYYFEFTDPATGERVRRRGFPDKRATEVVEKRTAVKVNGGVEGKVIKSRSNYAEVRILEGPHKGKAYFFPVEVVTR